MSREDSCGRSARRDGGKSLNTNQVGYYLEPLLNGEAFPEVPDLFF